MRKASDLDKIVTFLENIGIEVKFSPFEGKAFLRGILLDKGSLLIDLDKDPFLGDILHEAGHIAVLESGIRYASRGEITGEDGEMAAMLWSYAAALKIGFAPEQVFHSEGYKGDSEWLLEQYGAGNFIGLPLLQWMGLAYDSETARAEGRAPFPAMARWLRA